jgi:acyl carrier protein
MAPCPSLPAVILSEMQKIASDQKIDHVRFTDDLPLKDTDFDSLCFAILVARLEDDLGVDPFVSDVGFPVTLGDLIKFYEQVTPP